MEGASTIPKRLSLNIGTPAGGVLLISEPKRSSLDVLRQHCQREGCAAEVPLRLTCEGILRGLPKPKVASSSWAVPYPT